MFGSIGGPELILILLLALLLFGPRRLPQIGRSFGRALAEFRGAANEFKVGLEREVELEQVRERPSKARSTDQETPLAVAQAQRLDADVATPTPPVHGSQSPEP